MPLAALRRTTTVQNHPPHAEAVAHVAGPFDRRTSPVWSAPRGRGLVANDDWRPRASSVGYTI
jgi:hypothetical protein